MEVFSKDIMAAINEGSPEDFSGRSFSDLFPEDGEEIE